MKDQRKHNERLDAIEEIMDGCENHTHFLELVAEVFSAKADHLRENWNDECMAQIYDANAAHLLNADAAVQRSMQ